MTIFSYRGKLEGKTGTKGVLEATSEHAARMQLAAQGLTDLQVREKKGFLKFEVTRRRVKPDEVMQFSRQLAAFVRAGIPILDAIEVIRGDVPNPRMQQVLTDMRDSIAEGGTFADAAAAHSDVFPSFYIGSLRAAELTGALDTVLDQLSIYLERNMQARNRIRSALIYPSVVLFLAIGTAAVLTTFVLPRFEKFFSSLHAKLPLATRTLLNASHVITHWWPVIVGGLVGVVLAIYLYFRTERGRWTRDWLLLRIPALGDVVRHAMIERFCRILASMVQAGVPLPDALAVAGDGTSSVIYERGIERAREQMITGEGLANPIAHTQLFPGAMVQMLRVGENTGTLDEQLENAAKFYGTELEYKLSRLTSLFEPAVILLMGLVVGFVAIALVSAMYGIFNQVNTVR